MKTTNDKHMVTWGGKLRALWRNKRGGPALEFALIAPILTTCLIFVYDLGNSLQEHIRLREAVRAGGLYAVYFNASFDGMTSAVRAAVPEWTPDNVSLTVPAVTWACYCWTSTTNVSAPTACTPAAPGNCASSVEMQRFVSFRATKRFSAIFLTNMSLVSVNHVVRVQ